MFIVALVLGLAWAANGCCLPGWPLGRAAFGSANAHAVADHSISHAVIPPVDAVSPIGHHKFRRPKLQYRDQDYKIPPYYETNQLVKQMEELVLSHTSFQNKPPPTDPLRQYMLLLGVIYHITEVLSETCHPDPVMYDDEYMPLLEEYVSIAWNDPKSPATEINQYINIARSKTEDIRSLIDNLCGRDMSDPITCDSIVAGVLVWSPESYKKQAKLLLKFGQVAQVFQELSDEFEDVAKNNQVLNYLLDDLVKERLKPLVLTAAEAIDSLDLVGHCDIPHPPTTLPIQPVPGMSLKKWKKSSSLIKVPLAREPLTTNNHMQGVPAIWGLKK